MGYAVHQEIDNTDLVWGLEHISQQQRAADFVKRFENKLCIYSPSVSQVYSNYSIFFPEDQNKSMVVLPDPYAFHDTFNHIPEEAIQATGLHIIPGENKCTTIVKSGEDFSATTPKRCTSCGKRGKALLTRFCTCTCARSKSVPKANVTVNVIRPSLVACENI